MKTRFLSTSLYLADQCEHFVVCPLPRFACDSRCAVVNSVLWHDPQRPQTPTRWGPMDVRPRWPLTAIGYAGFVHPCPLLIQLHDEMLYFNYFEGCKLASLPKRNWQLSCYFDTCWASKNCYKSINPWKPIFRKNYVCCQRILTTTYFGRGTLLF